MLRTLSKNTNDKVQISIPELRKREKEVESGWSGEMIKLPLSSHIYSYCVEEGKVIYVLQKGTCITCTHVGKAKCVCTTRVFQFVHVYVFGY